MAFPSDPDGAGNAGLAIFEGAQSQDDLALCECCGVSEVPSVAQHECRSATENPHVNISPSPSK